MIVFIVPKNSGLEVCESIARNYSKKIVKSRGEDVPRFVSELVKQNKNVIGITGEDLFEEFIRNNGNSNIKIIKKISWKDNNTLFGKPTLCLLGSENKSIDELPKNVRVCINKKYRKIADEFLSNMKSNKKFNFEKIYLSGATEETFATGISDLVIDIVYSGKSMRENGLRVYEKIFESDIVIIGKNPAKIDNKCYSAEDFNLEQLYDKIVERMNSNDTGSYTKKLKENPSFLKRKIVEEAAEVITENPENKQRLIEEFADLFYNILVYMAINEIKIEDIEKENLRRNK